MVTFSAFSAEGLAYGGTHNFLLVLRQILQVTFEAISAPVASSLLNCLVE